MPDSFFLRGLIIGFSIAAPVGPIGVLCIRRTLAHSRRAGFVSGLGAASADAVYGAIAAFGLTAISGLLVSQQTLLRLAGGLFLCYLGFTSFRAQPVMPSAAAPAGRSPVAAYGSTFALTLTNPMTIISFAAIFAGAGLSGGAGDARAAVALVLGVFLGSALWWLTLSSGVSLLRTRVDTRALQWVNRISGGIIGLFGLSVLLSLV